MKREWPRNASLMAILIPKSLSPSDVGRRLKQGACPFGSVLPMDVTWPSSDLDLVEPMSYLKLTAVVYGYLPMLPARASARSACAAPPRGLEFHEGRVDRAVLCAALFRGAQGQRAARNRGDLGWLKARKGPRSRFSGEKKAPRECPCLSGKLYRDCCGPFHKEGVAKYMKYI